MELPRGYVGYTVPYTLEFNSNVVGLDKPFYSQGMREWIVSNGTNSVYGFDYQLILHNEKAGGIQPFPAQTTIQQNVVLDGLAEFDDGEQIPFAENFYEEFALYNNLASDVHWFGSTPATDGIARYQLTLAYAAAVMPRLASWQNGNTEVPLNAAEQAEFADSLTFVIGLFYGLDIGLSASPAHWMDWNAQTIDPARGRSVTWDSGSLHYEGNSPGKRRQGPSREKTHVRRSVHGTVECCPSESACVARLEHRALGPQSSFWALRLNGEGVSTEIILKGPKPDLHVDEKGRLFLGGLEVLLCDSPDASCDSSTVLLPRLGGVHVVLSVAEKGAGKLAVCEPGCRSFRFMYKDLAPFSPYEP